MARQSSSETLILSIAMCFCAGLCVLATLLGHLSAPPAATATAESAAVASRGTAAEAPAAGAAEVEVAPSGEEPSELERRLIRFEEAVAREPGNATYHNNVAVTLLELGRHEEASRAFDRAVELDPGDEAIRENRERAREAQAKGEETVLVAAVMLLVALSGLFLPYRWNPCRLRSRLAALLPEEINLRIARVISAVLVCGLSAFLYLELTGA